MQLERTPHPTTPNMFQPVGVVVARIVERTLAHAKARAHE